MNINKGISREDESRMRQNLLDAGIDTSEAEKIVSLLDSGNREAAMRKLREQRAVLLENLHISQRRIDCFDYLLRKMEKKEG
ncbi:MAG: hypothetical protein IKR28_06695 [Selenomonadaceae bacterium]|nr:hypothetical protein [Selenomonadaceae bacterium]